MKKCFFKNDDFNFTTEGSNLVSKHWANRLNLKILTQNSEAINPNKEFDYKKEFEKLNMSELKDDLKSIMKTSQEWWPSDFGHYGPLFIRLAWHSAGTYRLIDGKGGANSGNMRFAPFNSWPDNANLDKARRLLLPIKRKYGNKISWADLMILAGNVALEDMGFKTLGFGGGRVDRWEAEIESYWGDATEWLGSNKNEKGEIKNSLAAVQMGLIYVNPEGPNGEPDVIGAANEIRDSFRRMGMSDEETIALIAGGHTFGKNHGAADPSKYVGLQPEAAPIEEVGLGWKNSFGSGKGKDTITSGLEGAWTPTPTKWDNSFLRVLFKYEWSLQKSPAGAWQWVAINPDKEDLVVDAHNPTIKHAPIMLTTDLALKQDPKFAKISKSFLEDFSKFEEAFAKAWFKLTHRDLGVKSRYLGSEVPKENFIWQDPIPDINYKLIESRDIENLKKKALQNASISELVYTAFSAASTFRKSDFRGGVNGARIALKPQINWEINSKYVSNTIKVLQEIKDDFNKNSKDKKISLADLIVIAGSAAVEEAIKKAGFNIKVPIKIGRNDTTQELTDEFTFSFLEPIANGFLNYKNSVCNVIEERVLIDFANKLDLNVWQMSVLVAGLRALDATFDKSINSLVCQKEVLSNEFFVNLLNSNIEWKRDKNTQRELFNGVDIRTGDTLYKASRVDLIFASNSELRAQAEFYAQDDNKEKFIKDFVKTWVKVMELDLV